MGQLIVQLVAASFYWSSGARMREKKIDEIEYQYMELITLKPFDYKKSQKYKPN